MANWGGITSDAAQSLTYGDTTGFNNANAGGWSSKDLIAALQAAGKTANAQTDKDPGFLSPQSAAPGQPMRRASLDQLVAMLNKQRDTLYASAMTPGGKAEPYSPPRTIGLLGF